jgi:hypothetical protein
MTDEIRTQIEKWASLMGTAGAIVSQRCWSQRCDDWGLSRAGNTRRDAFRIYLAAYEVAYRERKRRDATHET